MVKSALYFVIILFFIFQGLIGRLGDVIPNFIRLSLFVKFKDSLRELVLRRVCNPAVFTSYFNISEMKKIEYNELKVTLEKLHECAKELDELKSK